MAHDIEGAKPAIVKAFTRLVLEKRDARPRITEILNEAGVARSTFYEHFDGRDSLLLESFRGPLSIIADATTGVASQERLVPILEHLREYRRGAIEMLSGPLSTRLMRALASLVAERLPASAGRDALHLAHMELGFIHLWLTGETPYSAPELADRMIRSAEAFRAAMIETRPD